MATTIGQSCVLPKQSEKLSKKVMSMLSEQQLKKWNLSTALRREDAEKALANIIELHVGGQKDPNVRDHMLDSPEEFIDYIDKLYTVNKVPEDAYEDALKRYEEAKKFVESSNTGHITTFNFDDTEQDEKGVEEFLLALNSYGNVVSPPIITQYKNKRVKSISFALREPQKIEGLIAQQKTVQDLKKIAKLSEIELYDSEHKQNKSTIFVASEDEIPAGWRRTGRYNYDGKSIRAIGVTRDVNPQPYTGPVVSRYIGNGVDKVGRYVFNKDSKLWNKDGTLVGKEQLEKIIAEDLGGIFTVQGLTNLVNDFQKLEKELKEKFQDDNIIILSDEIRLFGRKPSSGEWIIGIPDLLVVDSKGKIHVVDFKTHKMSNTTGYTNVFHDDTEDKYRTGETYGKQISRYIKMLESYGFSVDEEAFVVLVDTWYDSSDTIEARNNKENDKKIYNLPDDNDKSQTVKVTGANGIDITLGQYSEANPYTRERIVGKDANKREDDSDKTILYIEPRLHVKYDEDAGKLSDELAALRGKEDIPFDNTASYEEQWKNLSDEDRENLSWYNAAPLTFKPVYGLTKLSNKDIESNPELISSQEIQDVAEFMMYKVSRTITALQNGEQIPEFPRSVAEEGKTSKLKGQERKDIIKIVGLDNLIDYAFKTIENHYKENFPTEEQFQNDDYDEDEYSFDDIVDYRNQKMMSDKAEWLIKHKEQFIMTGSAKLMSLEDVGIRKNDDYNKSKNSPNVRPDMTDEQVSQDNGDNEATEAYIEKLIDGLTSVEAWMMNALNYSPKASLAQEIKRLYEDLDLTDSAGNKVIDSYGWSFSMPISATKAIQTTLDACKYCETFEDMEGALKDLARSPQNRWAQQVLDRLNQDERLKTKFYRHFRKDALNYGIAQVVFNKKTGKREVVTKIINMKSAYDTITQSLGATFNKGKVGEFEVEGVVYNAVVEDGSTGRNTLAKIGNRYVVDLIKARIEELQKYSTAIQKDRNVTVNFGKQRMNKEERLAYLGREIRERKFRISGKDKEQTLIQGVTEVLKGIGVLVNEQIVEDFCMQKVQGEKSNNAKKLLDMALDVITELKNQNSTNEKIPASLTGLKAYRYYVPILASLADSVQDVVEASVYQDGKTYFSFANPSSLQYRINNMKDAMETYDPGIKDGNSRFEKYLKHNFGRYTGWFKSTDGTEWLCDWIDQFENSKVAREALQHKVELSYIGNHYRDLGSLGFQLSILHNYFGSKDDNVTNEDYRWFALPTMSNKPTNEYIRMIKYGKRGRGSYQKDIIDNVLMKTFIQEMNRMADTLYHYAYGGAVTDQIDITDKKLKDVGLDNNARKQLKERIKSSTLTVEDLITLGKITSGAKFHFLWHLNNSIAEDENLASKIANRLNTLLTPKENQRINADTEARTLELVRNTISRNMQSIVESELQNMRSIGLFDRETKIVNVNGRKTEIEILKYQEEFGNNLGRDREAFIKDFKNVNHRTPTETEIIDGMEEEMVNKLTEFIWQDIAANINIIQITGGDLAYYGTAVNYQKRIAQIHSPGLKLMHNPAYDDNYLRSVHIKDEKMREEIIANTEVALSNYMDKNITGEGNREEYRNMIKYIISNLKDSLPTDGQSFSSPTSIRKKLISQGLWSDEMEDAYKAIRSGNFNINHLSVLIQPSKPFVTSDVAKYSGSTTMAIRKTPLQDKNSEYLIILAEALARGSGQKSKLVAICDFMEATAYDSVTKDEKGNKVYSGYNRHGIDTTHFGSVGKVGLTGVIDIPAFDEDFDRRVEEGKITYDVYNDALTEYLLMHTRTRNSGKPNLQSEESYTEINKLKDADILKEEETLYNSDYVDTIPLNDYIIQQEVPAHLFDPNGQLYGSQIRILGISDITEGTVFNVNGKQMEAEELVEEYKELHAQNIRSTYKELMKELGIDDIDEYRKKAVKEKRLLSKEEFIDQSIEDGTLSFKTEEDFRNAERRYEDYLNDNTFNSIMEMPVGTPERNNFLKNLEYILQKELSKDAKYGLDMRRACSLEYSGNNPVDFVVPLMDPIQAKRIQMLINSIIKKTINKQKITGGPVVQVTAYDRDLHIRFKDEQGNILPTLEEYFGKREITESLVDKYKEFLKEKHASISHFECYMSIPNEELERLITNPDGSIMSIEEMQKKLPKEVWNSMSQVIGYRIPTEDKYSMLPLKIVGFLPKAAGQVIMMPQEITHLTGSDFDIDKLYIMMKKFDIKTKEVDKESWMDILKQYFQETKNRHRGEYWKESVQQIIEIGNTILNDKDASWDIRQITLGVKAQKQELIPFMMWYRDKILSNKDTFKQFTDMEDSNVLNSKYARDNRILDLQWAVLTNEDTLPKMLNAGNFLAIKKTGRMIKIIKNGTINPKTDRVWSWEDLSKLDVKQLDALIENSNPHNTTLPSSKIYFQRQNMQGTQMVGIFANNNVSHAFMTFQKVGIDLMKHGKDRSFMFDGHLIGNPTRMTVLDPQKGFNGQLISKTIANFLEASVDTAKDPTLSDMNVNTYTGGVAMVLARLGFDTEAIGLFLSQPVIMQLSDLYFKNKTNGYYDGNTAIKDLAEILGFDMKEFELESTEGIQDMTLSKENFIDHLNDVDYAEDGDNFQKRVLKGFWALYQIANDLQDLTFCTKFNSVSNAVGPTLADTIEDMDRVERFLSNIDSSVFYEPKTDSEEYTSPSEVINNDPILKAFYDTTVGYDGASRKIFMNFFPHYYKGFQNVKARFQEEYMGGKKLSSKLYNQLLDEYLYYLLTYTDNENFKATLPSTGENGKEYDYLIKGLVKRYEEIKKYKRSKSNLLLDSELGSGFLRIREKDEYIATDTLVFDGSRLDAEGQQKVRNVWSDLISGQDPALSKEENDNINRFGVDLFFYTLMRNGFGFSPKTLMHLASVIVRENALYGPSDSYNTYIEGLRNLQRVDEYLMKESTENADRYLKQFMRNHANNKQIVPNIDFQNPIIHLIGDNEIVFGVPSKQQSQLYPIKVGDKPSKFVTVTTKHGNTLSQELYELVAIPGSTSAFFEDDDKICVKYRKSSRLGMVNNFIEYDANSDIENSYFETIRNESESSDDFEDSAPAQRKDDNYNDGGSNEETAGSNTSYWTSSVMPLLLNLEGPQSGYTDTASKRRIKLKRAYNKGENSDLKNAIDELVSAKKNEKQGVMNKINEIFDQQNKCNTL